MEAAAVNMSTPLIPGMAQMEPGVDPSSPLGRLISISSKLMDNLYFCPAIPPELCKELAQTSKGHNRLPSYNHLNLMAQAMRAGTWCKRIGWDIHFHNDGWLANGQHRLTAAHKAGVPFYALIHTGLDSRAVGGIDQGRKRTPKDILAISFGGVDNATNLAAAARAFIQYKRGDLAFAVSIDPYSVCETAYSFSDAQKAIVTKVMKCAYDMGLLVSVASGVLLAWHERQPDKCTAFLDRLASGIATDSTDPTFLFRQFVVKRKMAAKGQRWQRKAFGQAMIKAANLEMSGAKVSNFITTTRDGSLLDLSCYHVLDAEKNKQGSLLN